MAFSTAATTTNSSSTDNAGGRAGVLVFVSAEEGANGNLLTLKIPHTERQGERELLKLRVVVNSRALTRVCVCVKEGQRGSGVALMKID